jgi:hypothetical protein
MLVGLAAALIVGAPCGEGTGEGEGLGEGIDLMVLALGPPQPVSITSSSVEKPRAAAILIIR